MKNGQKSAHAFCRILVASQPIAAPSTVGYQTIAKTIPDLDPRPDLSYGGGKDIQLKPKVKYTRCVPKFRTIRR